ncbi:citrulline utilization hydrolase CtlX [Croceimicrobium hydrocarbonivorans]|uniref:Amidinotransferase n=1 Tax=Croceimicrobium hydrocarbonivorans TaxID=2761580 RepID=A0A7H0VDT2_9FLAO|nr:arginine deiminase-related protein [Croceimicrobium hydrocarbonivorans]QNR23880.1 amidinotransferase [Croceimicrobium hydrocarbonivorans]
MHFNFNQAQDGFGNKLSAQQSTSQILMIRPARFGFNSETADSNSFQENSGEEASAIQNRALAEFDAMVEKLRSKGVKILVADDTDLPIKPDAIFPNNWVSFHGRGVMVLHPMKARNRRWERRPVLVRTLKCGFQVKTILDLSESESRGEFLEGTGSLVLDRIHHIAYAALSPRTHMSALKDFCDHLEYELHAFHTLDFKGQEIYHTNVILTLGTDFAVICAEAISDEEERNSVLKTLQQSGKDLILISPEQVQNYCGNMLEVRSEEGRAFLVVSETALKAFDSSQIRQLEKYVELIPVSINTIEKVGGGSARCMMAEIF